MLNVLLAVHELDFHVEFLVDVLSHVLGAVDRAVLPSGAAEAHHQVGETALDISLDRGIDQPIGVIEKGQYLSIVFKKLDHGLVKADIRLEAVILARVVAGAAVKDKAAAIFSK